MQWAVAGKLDDESLLLACRQDLRHDQLVEDSRGAWLWQLVRAVDGQERLRGPLLEELRALRDERSAYQLCELAYFYAERGEDDFRKRLYEIVEQNDDQESRLGEDEILRLDGKDAFVFTARVRGKRLDHRGWDWDDDSFINNAVEQLGEDEVSRLLERTDDRFVKRFQAGWLAAEKTTPEAEPRRSHIIRMKAISVGDIIAAAESESPSFGRFRYWGMQACDADLKTILNALWAAQGPQVIRSYLRVFSNRALPTFDPRLIELCSHADEQVRHSALRALQMNSHRLVREFALANIVKGLRGGGFGGLLIRNYAPGDETLILDALELPDDVNELHWLLYDVNGVLKNNDSADPSKLGLIIYAHTPCEHCRFYAARALHSHKIAPEWMPAECRFDSDEECRKLFQVTDGESASLIR